MDLNHAMEMEELKAKLLVCQKKCSQLQNDTSLNYAALLDENRKLLDDHNKLKDRYDRLYESNKKLQKNNHCLESKLITAIENISEEKKILWSDLCNQTSKLMDTQLLIADLYEALEKYRLDCNLALQLLQSGSSKPDYQPLTKLPPELQRRIEKYLPSSLKKSSSENSFRSHHTNNIFPTFPPTATFYTQASLDTSDLNCVPTSDIVEMLSKPELFTERTRKIALCNQCMNHRTLVESSCQTEESSNNDFSGNVSYSIHGNIYHI